MNLILPCTVYVLVPIGPVGCGKTTLGRCLTTLYGWPHVTGQSVLTSDSAMLHDASCDIASSVCDAALSHARAHVGGAGPGSETGSGSGAGAGSGAGGAGFRPPSPPVMVYADGNYHIERERKILITTLTERVEPYVESLRFIALYFDHRPTAGSALPVWESSMFVPAPSVSPSAVLPLAPAPRFRRSASALKGLNRMGTNHSASAYYHRLYAPNFDPVQPLSAIRPHFDEVIELSGPTYSGSLSVGYARSVRENLLQLLVTMDSAGVLPYYPSEDEQNSIVCMVFHDARTHHPLGPVAGPQRQMSNGSNSSLSIASRSTSASSLYSL